MTLRRGWLLWADWCLATGRTSLDVTEDALAAFGREVAGDHLPAIRATAREAGMRWPWPDEPLDPWRAAETGLLGLDEALRRCPRAGWPHGYAGRRDAWLLVLTRGLRMTRAQAVAVRAEDVQVGGSGLAAAAAPGRGGAHRGRVPGRGGIRVTGVPLEPGTDPATCRACVAWRWLECLVQHDQWGRSGVREMLASDTATAALGHLCDGRLVSRGEGGPPDRAGSREFAPLPTRLPSLPGRSVLAPSIDQHGWADVYRPMSPRAVTTVIAGRCSPRLEAQVPTADDQAGGTEDEQAARVVWTEVSLARLERVCAAADEVNGRVADLLAETAAVLAGNRRA